MGHTGKLYKGFCQSIYRKAHNINRQICQLVSRQLVDWAVQEGATVMRYNLLQNERSPLPPAQVIQLIESAFPGYSFLPKL